ncbi:hypothetical protein B0T19DRAFT_472754 [Cercophora scortea]|uniref:Xylanolytic transcriptional activator regulatory domain-containing protein n=1 Tax=Cercophora scortea TaxID=314031 RepID=A0AAE0IVI1_9PEZI|nr:hypothetical protein B0T19DRAFT_472754 [Cercophora scortea]
MAEQEPGAKRREFRAECVRTAQTLRGSGLAPLAIYLLRTALGLRRHYYDDIRRKQTIAVYNRLAAGVFYSLALFRDFLEHNPVIISSPCQGFDDIQSRLIQMQDELSSLTNMVRDARITDPVPLDGGISSELAAQEHVGAVPSKVNSRTASTPLAQGHLVRDDTGSVEKYHGPWTLIARCRDFAADLATFFGNDDATLTRLVHQMSNHAQGQWTFDKPEDMEQQNHDQNRIGLPSRHILSVVVDSFLDRGEIGADIFLQSSLQKAIQKAYTNPASPESESWAVCFNLIILLVISTEQGTSKHDPFVQPLLHAVNAAAWRPALYMSQRLVNVQALALLSLVLQQLHSESLGDALFSQACILAQSLGLHQTGFGLGSSPLSDDESQERQKVYMSLYVRDFGSSIARGSLTWLPHSALQFPPPVRTKTENSKTDPLSPKTPTTTFFDRNQVAWYELSRIQSRLHRHIFPAETAPVLRPEHRVSSHSLRQSLELWSQKYGVPALSAPTTVNDISLHLAFLGTRMQILGAVDKTKKESTTSAQLLHDARLSALLLIVACAPQRDEDMLKRLNWLLNTRKAASNAATANSQTPPSSPSPTPSSLTMDSKPCATPWPQHVGVHRLALSFPVIAPFIIARNILGMEEGTSDNTGRNPSQMERDAFSEEHTHAIDVAEDFALLQALHTSFANVQTITANSSDNHAVKLGRVVQSLLDIIATVKNANPTESDARNLGLGNTYNNHFSPTTATNAIDPLLTPAISPRFQHSPQKPPQHSNHVPTTSFDTQMGLPEPASPDLSSAGATTAFLESPWANHTTTFSSRSPSASAAINLGGLTASSGSEPHAVTAVTSPEISFDFSQFINHMNPDSINGMVWEDPREHSDVSPTTPHGQGMHPMDGMGRRKHGKRQRTSFSLGDEEEEEENIAGGFAAQFA